MRWWVRVDDLRGFGVGRCCYNHRSPRNPNLSRQPRGVPIHLGFQIFLDWPAKLEILCQLRSFAYSSSRNLLPQGAYSSCSEVQKMNLKSELCFHYYASLLWDASL